MTKVKICGLTRLADIVAVNRLMPCYVGLVFAPSRRRVDGQTAAKLRERLNPLIQTVGVFVNEEMDTVADLYGRGVINLAQLHGDEDGDYIRRLKNRCGCPVIKAVGIGGSLPPLPGNADFLLFDTLSRQRGGTGKGFDLSILTGYDRLPFFVAGGLSEKNVCEAIRRLAPYGVDVSSGVETDGIKDPGKMERFIKLARQGAY